MIITMENKIEISKDEQVLYRVKISLFTFIYDLIVYIIFLSLVLFFAYACIKKSALFVAIVMLLFSCPLFTVLCKFIMGFNDELVVSNRCLRWKRYGNYGAIDWDEVESFSFETLPKGVKELVVKPKRKDVIKILLRNLSYDLDSLSTSINKALNNNKKKSRGAAADSEKNVDTANYVKEH